MLATKYAFTLESSDGYRHVITIRQLETGATKQMTTVALDTTRLLRHLEGLTDGCFEGWFPTRKKKK